MILSVSVTLFGLVNRPEMSYGAAADRWAEL